MRTNENEKSNVVKKQLTRRDFIGKTTAGIATAAFSTGISSIGISSCKQNNNSGNGRKYPEGDFTDLLERTLPKEELYDYHRQLSADPVHVLRRDPEALPTGNEMMLPDQGWKLKMGKSTSMIIQNAALDFQDYLDISQNVKVEIEERISLADWHGFKQSIIAGTREELPGCGLTLKTPKSYEISVTPEQIIICGYDERGVMFGLCNLESRMNLREAPFLPKELKTARESLFDTRMVLSWMGWMEWPDQLLSHLVHDGFDAIFASVYANPNGDRTTAETSTDFYARILYKMREQDPTGIRDLINRTAQFGIKVYAPVIYQYLGTRESELGLRNLVREIVKEFPDIRGYVLLTEGFWYKAWGGGHGASKEYMQDWARNWSKAVKIVEEECHRTDPSIEIIPWEYNIDFRPQNSDIKRYFIKQLPQNTNPMLTWENGKSFELDGMKGHLRDYSLSQIGPAEVTDAQIDEAEKRKMKVYSKVDTFASWQYGTIPYLPCPNQWYDRYMALEKYGVKGTLESWSSGYKPNFISTIRAWEYFSQAIRLVPDTGPNMGTNNAIGNPLFFQEPPARTATYKYSWGDQDKKMNLNPYWPFTVSRMVFYPDFTNKTDRAEQYARRATGLGDVNKKTKVLPAFLKYLKKASDKMEDGLKLYRTAAYNSPESKRKQALREVVVAEQLQRMMQSDYAILQFEDLRLKLVKEQEIEKAGVLFDQMEIIVREEIVRTELSLLAATRDSRLGFQFEQDYVYTPYSLGEKLKVLKETLDIQLPNARNIKKIS